MKHMKLKQKKSHSDKNNMMVHRKNEHLHEVKACKNISAGLKCWKGLENCWYRHDNLNPNRATLETTRKNTTAVPPLNLQNFPLGPTPQGAVVGQASMELQIIHQTLQQQQQQLTTMMMALMKLTQ